MKNWVLMKGELCEGGKLIGLYATRELARDDFLAEVKDATRLSEIRQVYQESEDDIEVEVGCDWIRLTLWEVKTTPELPA